MGYQDEWLLLEAEDDIDEVEHRQPTEEFLFYQAVTAAVEDFIRDFEDLAGAGKDMGTC